MKKNILNITPFIIGIACMIAFNIIGSRVEPNGTLVEPFFLIPCAYISFAIGILGFIMKYVVKKQDHN